MQGRLRELGLLGPLDGKYGGGTEAAVRLFQKQNNIPVNGVVDDDTWSKLLPGQQAAGLAIAVHQSLSVRCLALTASFETSTFPPDCFCGIAGNFDGQGLSFGALQWNLGQGTLQPMVHRFLSDHSDLAESFSTSTFRG